MNLTASNYIGESYAETNITVSSGAQVPVADFTAEPTIGYNPLTVRFTDSSSNSPTSWLWEFGDGDSTNATAQNPVHTYISTGTYTVNLTATNGGGSDVEEKVDYIAVTASSIDYYVFSDGVRYYHNYEGNYDLPDADMMAQIFTQNMTERNRCNTDNQGTQYCWNERSTLVNDASGGKYWNKSELADSVGANSAEFAFHSGHGGNNGTLYGTANNFYRINRTDMRFSRTKWVVLNSCNVLNETTQEDWESVFDGLHILMSYDTIGVINASISDEFIERMKGGSYDGTQYPRTKIRDAWKYTLQDIIHDSNLKGAYMAAEPSQDDYLPGYGDFQEPVKNNGVYVFGYSSFTCFPGM